MKYLLSLMLCLSTLQISHAGDGKILGTYIAVLSSQDHFSSKGKRLNDAASILRQDRANFHKFGKTDIEDGGEEFFDSVSGRAKIQKLFRNGKISKSTARIITNSEPTVVVYIYRSKIKVEIL